MKKILILIVAIILVVGGFLGWVFTREEGGVPILAYHQVNNIDKNQLTTTVEDFDAQMKYLVDNGYTIITPEELVTAWGGVEGEVADGHLENYKNVFPILQKYNIRATLFVITDYLNLYPNYITWAQAREMQSSGLVDIESHTLSHFNLVERRLSHYEIRNQLYGSKQAIEWYLKKPADYVAYPGGLYTQEIEDLTKDVGYKAAFTVDYGLSHQLPQHYVLPRIPIFGNNSYPLLRFKIRLKLAPLIAPLHRFKEQLIKDGNDAVADFIWIP